MISSIFSLSVFLPGKGWTKEYMFDNILQNPDHEKKKRAIGLAWNISAAIQLHRKLLSINYLLSLFLCQILRIYRELLFELYHLSMGYFCKPWSFYRRTWLIPFPKDTKVYFVVQLAMAELGNTIFLLKLSASSKFVFTADNGCVVIFLLSCEMSLK